MSLERFNSYPRKISVGGSSSGVITRHRWVGPGTGERGAARLPPDRRGADPGCALGGAGDGPALAAGPVRRRRARPEEGRGDVRGLRHEARAAMAWRP